MQYIYILLLLPLLFKKLCLDLSKQKQNDMKINFDYNGFNLDIQYDMQPSDDSVGFKGSFDIEEVLYNGEDITLLIEPQIEHLESELYDHIKKIDSDI